MPLVICEQCAKEFNKYPSRIKKYKRHFCSTACFHKSRIGFKHSEEAKRKMSEGRRGEKNHNYGKTPSIETRKKLSEALKGRPLSEETRRKMSESRKGRVFSEKHKQNISKALKGKTLSKEHKINVSKALLGEKNPNYGKHFSDEHRLKISLAARGRIFSPEHRRKLSEGHISEKNHNWKGGISFWPYGSEFNEVLKREIRERDSDQCQKCGKLGKCVHHIDGDKLNNEKWNLITLCNSCNLKEQHYRDEWIPFFYSIVRDRPPLGLGLRPAEEKTTTPSSEVVQVYPVKQEASLLVGR